MRLVRSALLAALAVGRTTLPVAVATLAPLAEARADGGLVVWLEPAVPGEKQTGRADHLTGPSQHVAHPDLAFPPQPATQADQKAYDHLREVMANSKAKWDEFEVEYGIATDLQAAIDAIDVVRDDRDVDVLVQAYALEGAAVDRAFDPTEWKDGSDRTKPFRLVTDDGKIWNVPWLRAAALAPTHKIDQSQADASTWADLQAVQDDFATLPAAHLDVKALPKNAKLVVDGREADVSQGTVELRPGVHYVHALIGGVVSGRQKADVAPGGQASLQLAVSADDLAAARKQVVDGSTAGFPASVKGALDAIATRYNGPVFVGAVDESRAVVVPYAHGAQLLRQHPVTVVASGDVGPEAVVSPLFDDSEGAYVTAPGLAGSLGMEIGIYNGVILGGMDLAFTPGQTVTYANKDLTANQSTSALPQPWGGVGVYVLRPIGTSPTLLLAGTYGWDGPANMAFGGRLTLGLPMADEGSWLRITLGGNTSSDVVEKWQAVRDAPTPMHVLFLRVGLERLF